LELANHPLVRNMGTALLVTHGCPSTHMVKSLQPRPGGMYLPDYADIKAGNYDGPPLQYTATTALKKNHETGIWDLAPGFKVFSNEHDPRLKEARKEKRQRMTRYVFPDCTPKDGVPLTDFQVPLEEILGVKAGQLFTTVNPRTGKEVTFTVPPEYKGGDRIRVRVPTDAGFNARELSEAGVA
jgi:hypothetical protein